MEQRNQLSSCLETPETRKLFIQVENLLQKRHLTIKYSPTAPENPESNTFHATDEFLNIDGEQLKYSPTFFDKTGHYFYTGSIEDQTDTGIFFDQENDLYIVSVPSKLESSRVN